MSRPARALTLWLTGLPGSGKSTLALGLAARLQAQGEPHQVLDGDVLRAGLCSDLGFSAADRRENIRRVAEVAALMNRAGMTVICALISPLAEARAMARAIVGPPSFVEVHVAAPLAVCEARDPKGLYRRARSGALADFTGVDAPYEAPAQAALHIDTSQESVAASVERLHRCWMQQRSVGALAAQRST